VPHVRPSVRGTKTMGEAQRPLFAGIDRQMTRVKDPGQLSERVRWAAPIFFVPGTLWRTWGTRRFPPRRLRHTSSLRSQAFLRWNRSG
jgi:hypothetical protein